MRSNSIRDIKLALCCFASILFCFILFYLIATMFISMGYKSYDEKVFGELTKDDDRCVIVIDPGHGGEDPGAVANDLIEKDLNIDIARRLYELLDTCGLKTVLTRNGDYLLYDNQNESIKRQDLSNRVKIAESYSNACYVGIHMNKYPAEFCKGLQTFYSNNNKDSYVLSSLIQKNAVIFQKDNKRVNKDGTQNIFVLQHLNVPAVLVECAFLSNLDDAKNLSMDDYKQSLAFSIYYGIAEYMENCR